MYTLYQYSWVHAIANIVSFISLISRKPQDPSYTMLTCRTLHANSVDEPLGYSQPLTTCIWLWAVALLTVRSGATAIYGWIRHRLLMRDATAQVRRVCSCVYSHCLQCDKNDPLLLLCSIEFCHSLYINILRSRLIGLTFTYDFLLFSTCVTGEVRRWRCDKIFKPKMSQQLYRQRYTGGSVGITSPNFSTCWIARHLWEFEYNFCSVHLKFDQGLDILTFFRWNLAHWLVVTWSEARRVSTLFSS